MHRLLAGCIGLVIGVVLDSTDRQQFGIGRRDDELDPLHAVRASGASGKPHQGQATFRLEAGREQRRFDRGREIGDVLEPRRKHPALVDGDERGDVARGGRSAIVRDGVVEERVAARLGEGGEKRANLLVVTPRAHGGAQVCLDGDHVHVKPLGGRLGWAAYGRRASGRKAGGLECVAHEASQIFERFNCNLPPETRGCHGAGVGRRQACERGTRSPPSMPQPFSEGSLTRSHEKDHPAS